MKLTWFVIYFPFVRSFEIHNLDKPEYRSRFKFPLHLNTFFGTRAKGVLNLDNYFNPFGNQNCLVLLDNFASVDISPNKYPLILRKYSLALLQGKRNRQFQGWIHPDLPSYNGSPSNCPLSRYQSGIVMAPNNHWEDFCVTLNLTRFSSKIKPWSCQVHGSLFLTKFKASAYGKANTLQEYPSIFSCCAGKPNNLYHMPSSRPTLTIYVIQNKSDSARLMGQIFLHIKLAKNNYFGKDKVTHEMFVIFITQQHKLIPKMAKIDITSARVICITCGTSFKENLTTILSSQLSSLDKLVQSGVAFPKSADQVLWEIQPSKASDTMNTIETKVLTFMTNCGNSMTLNSAVDKLEFEFGRFWISIFKNHTCKLPMEYPWSCSNGRRIKKEWSTHTEIFLRSHGRLITKHINNFPISLNISLRSLRFVSCGEPTNAALPFKELTNIFETYVWIACFLTLLVLTILPMFFGRLSYPSVTTYLRNVEIQFRIYMGQDTPKEKLFVSEFLIVLMCLASVVLSNAYKYDNVYRMIAPKDDIPYKYFKQIRDAGYTTYTKSSSVSLNPLYIGMFNYMVTDPLADFIVTKQNLAENKKLGVIIQSDVAVQSGFFTTSALAYNELYLNSDLHPDLGKLVMSLAKEMNISTVEAPSERELTVFKEILQERERQLLFKNLKICNKTAVVLPTHMAQLFAIKLQKANKRFSETNFSRKQIDVSEEEYYHTYYTFSLKGNVPPFVMRRIKGAKMSGIFEWHHRRISSSIKYMPDTNRLVHSPTMSGNVLVIFVVFFVGLAIGIGFAVMEMLWYLSSFWFKGVYAVLDVVKSQFMKTFVAVSFQKFMLLCPAQTFVDDYK